ncbi:hypothetical protein D9M68_962190 [compost metagenome]
MVPLIWSARYLFSTLWRMVASLQLLGGPERSRITAASFHSMPPSGFWCSCMSPMAWPNSCATVPPSMKPRFMVGWSSGMLRLSVPT